MKSKGKVIAQYSQPEPPESVRTVGQWLEWHEAEKQRMFALLQAQLEAHFEREYENPSIH